MLVGYMRVSTADDRQSVDLQRDALLAAGVDERRMHQDRASGARDNRPGLKACMDDLRADDVLVVGKLDRLGRSLSHLVTIVSALKERDVAFRSLTEQMDTTTPHGKFLFNIFDSLAQFERALITERVNAGIAAARRRGRTGGGPQTIGPEQLEQIVDALDGDASKASVGRIFKVPRSTLLSTHEGSTGKAQGQGREPPTPTHDRRRDVGKRPPHDADARAAGDPMNDHIGRGALAVVEGAPLLLGIGGTEIDVTRDYAAASRAESMWRVYASDWRRFAA